MTKQHTFKTTKGTEWIDTLLEAEGDNKSAFIRHLLVRGLLATGYQLPYPEWALLNNNVMNYVSQSVTPQVTQVRQKVTHFVSPDVTHQMPDTSEDEPEIIALDRPEVDLDAALDSMNFD